MGNYVLRLLISLDQLANTVLGGYPDETISANLYRHQYRPANWLLMHVVDGVAWVLFKRDEHCCRAYEAEKLREQLPKYYQGN